MTDKCACSMTGAEALEEYITTRKPKRVVLIEDVGLGWKVTMYGPDAFGLPWECRTVQSVLERTEECVVNVRRQPEHPERGEIITDPARIIEEINASGVLTTK